MSEVSQDLFNIVKYSGNGVTERVEFTDAGYKLIAQVAFNGDFKPLSGQAVRMLLQCVNESRFNTSTKEFSSEVVNELMDPFAMGNTGAMVFPDQFQPWESHDDSFFVVDNPKKSGGNWIVSTHFAEIAANRITVEMNKVLARIKSHYKAPLMA